MFTGIVKELGVVRRVNRAGGLYKLEVESAVISRDINAGDSVAVNGVCLTLTGRKNAILSFDVMAETIARSHLASLKEKDRVNLEGALKAGDSLGGHFVTGHIDCVGTVRAIKKSGGEFLMEVGFPERFAGLVVEKGSVSLDGVSLTVGSAGRGSFEVYLIPHTLKVTTLASAKAGDGINVEFDLIGKYIARLKETEGHSAITEEFLRGKGF